MEGPEWLEKVICAARQRVESWPEDRRGPELSAIFESRGGTLDPCGECAGDEPGARPPDRRG